MNKNESKTIKVDRAALMDIQEPVTSGKVSGKYTEYRKKYPDMAFKRMEETKLRRFSGWLKSSELTVTEFISNRSARSDRFLTNNGTKDMK